MEAIAQGSQSEGVLSEVTESRRHSEERNWSQLVITFLSIAALLCYSISQLFVWLPWDFDDAFIVYRIVDNLLAGDGWVYNLGENHNASTSALNTVLIALASSIALKLPIDLSIPSVAHVLATAWIFLGALCLRSTLNRSLARPVASTLAALAYIWLMSFNSSWGLEIHLFAFLALLLILNLTPTPGSEMRPLSQRKLPWILCGLLVLARPDGALFAIFLGSWTLFNERRIPWRGIVLTSAPVLPWLAFSMMTFGQLFPDTLSNKVWQGESGLWGQGLIYAKGLVKQLFGQGPLPVVAYLVAVPGLVLAAKHRSPLLLLALFVLVQQTVYSTLNVPAYHWYFSIFDLSALVLSCYFVCWLAPFIVTNTRVSTIISFVVLFSLAAFSLEQLYNAQARPRYDLRNEAYKNAIQKIEAAGLTEGPIAVLEVGTPGYYTKRPIVDLVGLTSLNPPYVSGEHNDRFFANPPTIVLLQDPIWHFERAIADDVRFQLLYKQGVPIAHHFRSMQYFQLKDPLPDLSGSALQEQLESRYPVFEEIELGAKQASSTRALCIVDQVNGRLAKASAIESTSPLASFRGWAVLRTPDSTPSSSQIVLQGQSQNFAIQLSRTSRPDVAKHLGNESLNMAGYEASGLTTELARGTYSIAFLQDDQLCITGKSLVLK